MKSNTSSTTGWSPKRRRLDRALADAMRIVWKVLLQLGVADQLLMIGKCRAILDSVEADAIAAQLNAGVPTRKVEAMLHRAGSGGVSKRTVKKKARRGEAVRENPSLANKLASGELSEEQLDVLADASAKTEGDAACDDELIDKISAAPPEQGRKIAETFVRERMSQDDVDDAHARARKRRRVSRYSNTDRETDVLQIEGAPAEIDEIETQIDDLADKFYREDGGRDVPSGSHRRTRDQRRFDAAHSLIRGGGGASSDKTAEELARESAKAPAASSWKTTIVIRASLDQALGNDTSPVTLADGSLLPTSMIERLACGASFVGQIYGARGEVLHQGRAVRDATFAQRLALITRDGGCVRCDAGIARCVVHHLIPWTSRLLGETNIDQMVLVCDDCHHHIHDNDLTMFQDAQGIWRLRKAAVDEIAPKRPPNLRPKTRHDPNRTPPETARAGGQATFIDQQNLIQQE